MMTLTKIYRLSLITLVVMISALFVVCLVNEVRRTILISNNEDLLISLSYEIDTYTNLGFSPNDKVIHITKSRMDYVQKKIAQLKKQRRLICKDHGLKSVKKERLQELIKINQRMADAYRAEIQEYIKLGLQDSDAVVQEAKKTITSLSAEIAALENKVHEEGSQSYILAYNEKVNRMIAINKQSLELYKQEMAEYVALGLVKSSDRVQRVRTHITQKVEEIAELEQQL